MNLLTVVWRNISRRKTRSLLTIIGLGAAISAVVALVGVSAGFERSMMELYTRRSIDLVVQTKGGAQQLNNGIDEKLRYKIEELGGVKQVVGGLMDVVSFPDAELYTVIINGWPIDCPQFEEVTWLEGGRLHENDLKKVNIGAVLAKNLGKKVGDKIELYAEEYEIAGIFQSFSVYENGSIVILLKELQRLMDRPGQVTGYLVDVQDGASDSDTKQKIESIRTKIEGLSPKLSVQPTQKFVENVDQIKLSRAMAWVTSAIAVLIGSIGVLNTMVMSVIERTREIGTLRAIGWKKHRIVRMIVWESVILSLAGAILGILLAVILLRVLTQLPWTSGLIEGRPGPRVVLQGLAIAILVGVFGAVYPAMRGANLTPVEALRRK